MSHLCFLPAFTASSPGFDREDADRLDIRLSEAASVNYKPKVLEKGQIPEIIIRQVGSLEIQEVEFIAGNRAIFYGDSHELIFPMLERARQREIISLPINSILNADYHADITVYHPDTTNHTAS